MKEAIQTTNATTSRGNNMTKSMSDKTPNEKVSEAINLVKEAKNEKIQETRENLSETYSTGVEKARDFTEQAKSKYDEAKTQATEKFNETKLNAESRIIASPFNYLLGAGLIGLILGFIFGARRK